MLCRCGHRFPFALEAGASSVRVRRGTPEPRRSVKRVDSHARHAYTLGIGVSRWRIKHNRCHLRERGQDLRSESRQGHIALIGHSLKLVANGYRNACCQDDGFRDGHIAYTCKRFVPVCQAPAPSHPFRRTRGSCHAVNRAARAGRDCSRLQRADHAAGTGGRALNELCFSLRFHHARRLRPLPRRPVCRQHAFSSWSRRQRPRIGTAATRCYQSN